MKNNRGIYCSSTLHAVIFALLFFGFPNFFPPATDIQPEAISIDVLPISEISNVKPQEKTPEDQKKPIADKTTERKQEVESKPEETKPEEKPEVISAKELARKEKKPEKKKPEEKKKPKQDSFAAVLKSLDNTTKAEESKKPTQQRVQPNQHEARSQNYDSSQPLSISQIDAIRSQVEACWNFNIGAKNAADLTVLLHVQMNPDGSVLNVELADEQRSRASSDSFFSSAVDAAIRAVRRCSPYKNMPADKYGTWRDFMLSFIPPAM